MNQQIDLAPAALYARVSSDRQDVDLSVAAQLRALRHYAEKNGYVIARAYVDEAESGGSPYERWEKGEPSGWLEQPLYRGSRSPL